MIVRSRAGLLVAGMHRSGTSAVTRIINLLGATLPSNLMPAHEQFNATGFWESNDVVALNNALLVAAGSSWDDVLPVAQDSSTSPELTRIRTDIDHLLNAQFNASNWFVIKDPRMGRLLHFWVPALIDCGAVPKIVIPVRHPADVAASLTRRDGFSEGKSTYLWLRHMIDSVRHSQGHAYGIVVYEELLDDWRASIERLRKDIGIDWPRDVEQVAPAIDEFLSPALRHHACRSAAQIPTHGKIEQMARDFHAALVARSAALPEIAQAMHHDLLPTEDIYAPLLRDDQHQLANAASARSELEQQVAKLNDDFATKCRHVEHTEELLASERATYRTLEAQFKTKCDHIGLLSAEAAELRAHVVRLQAQLQAMPNNPSIPAHEGPAMSPLAHKLEELHQTATQKQEEFSEQRRRHEQMQHKQRQCRDEISRAEAQLELLKDLFLDR